MGGAQFRPADGRRKKKLRIAAEARFYPEKLDGDWYDALLNRDVTQNERAEAVMQYAQAFRFFEHATAGYFTITHSEYERIPSVAFEGLAIYQTLLAEYKKLNEKP